MKKRQDKNLTSCRFHCLFYETSIKAIIRNLKFFKSKKFCQCKSQFTLQFYAHCFFNFLIINQLHLFCNVINFAFLLSFYDVIFHKILKTMDVSRMNNGVWPKIDQSIWISLHKFILWFRFEFLSFLFSIYLRIFLWGNVFDNIFEHYIFCEISEFWFETVCC